ncbi:23S rRNA (uracil(1939)-C(5))-methyltransferase RlmD [Candidatus Peregrinibacteria bacterium]|nr:23S rRNA (uracil(1939)-C(5))-methyltransferase RlmD [Candidatus Peregrinibacteria bacterium]
MQLKKGQILEFDVHALAFGGAGLGKHEGLTIFVEKTMPGDRVRAALTKIKNNFCEARLVEVVKPSPDRIKARCPYFGVCGGCQLQFMPYEKQLQLKKQQVIDAFERIGKIYNPPVEEILGSGDVYYYRNKMEFSFGYDEKMQFALGLHVPERRFDILDLKECFLQSEFSVKLVNEIRDFVIEKGWKPAHVMWNEGLLKALFVRESRRTGEVMINITTSEEIPENFEKDFEELVEKILEVKNGEKNQSKKVVSIYWSKIINRGGEPKQIKEKLFYGKQVISEKMLLENGDELVFDILPQAFFQVNTLQAEILYSQVLKFALQKSHKMVFDLFCGTGTIGLFLAKHVGQVLGIELNKQAIKSARENARKNKIFNIDFFTGDVGKVLNNVREQPSLIVIDPPRAGLTEKTIQKINDFGANEIIYVSCNPATLARDSAWLAEYGYKIQKIQPVDMFPHTFHIECVCYFAR